MSLPCVERYGPHTCDPNSGPGGDECWGPATTEPWKCPGTTDGHHQYRTACAVCKEPGYLFVSIEPGDVQRANAGAEAVRAKALADACHVIQQSIDTIKGESDWEESATMRTSVNAREHVIRMLVPLAVDPAGARAAEPGRPAVSRIEVDGPVESVIADWLHRTGFVTKDSDPSDRGCTQSLSGTDLDTGLPVVTFTTAKTCSHAKDHKRQARILGRALRRAGLVP